MRDGKDPGTGDLFGELPPSAFGGKTYEPSRDFERLKGQLGRVFLLMQDGRWRTLAMIRKQTGGHDTEAAISARLRDFRKQEFGGHTVERHSCGGGLFQYRLILRRT
jgi:hypothetical protein